MYQTYRTVQPLCFSTLIINQCTYCDALLYTIFSIFPIISSQLQPNIFPSNPTSVTPWLWRVKFYLTVQQKWHYKYFHTHSSMQGDSWIVDISVGYGSNSQWLRIPTFNSCERILWTVRQTSWKLRNSCWKKWSLWNKGSMCYGVKFRLRIYHVMFCSLF